MLLSKRQIELEAQLFEAKNSPKVKFSDILDDLFEEINFQPYQKDEEGNIIHNAKGRAMLNWANIVTSAAKLLGKIIAIYYVRAVKK